MEAGIFTLLECYLNAPVQQESSGHQDETTQALGLPRGPPCGCLHIDHS